MRVAILRRAPKASFSMDVYADSLIRGLKAVRTDWEIIERSPILSVSSTRQTDWSAGCQKYYERYWQYPRTLKNLDVDICHVIDHSDGYLNYWLKRYKKPSVTTCHDLINLIKPETFQGRASFPLISMTAWKLAIQGMRESKHIIAVSSHTKKDAVEHLEIAPHAITVVPNAVDAIFRPLSQDDIHTFRHEKKISRDTLCLLNVGSNNARKNVLTALKALTVLKERGLSVLFWKVGADFNIEQKDFIKAYNLESCINYLGQPNEETLVKIYNAADVLLAPSLYEGFGLTILEAMACGTAVVTANVTSIPEVAGDAAILTDPLDVNAITKAIQQLHDKPLYHEELVERGLNRIKQFTWEKTAERVANIYEQVLGRCSAYE